MFRIAISKLFEWLFSSVLASHGGGSGSIRGQDMSVSGPWSSLFIVVTQTWSVLLDSEFTDLQVSDVNIQGSTTCKCKAANSWAYFAIANPLIS